MQKKELPLLTLGKIMMKINQKNLIFSFIASLFLISCGGGGSNPVKKELSVAEIKSKEAISAVSSGISTAVSGASISVNAGEKADKKEDWFGDDSTFTTSSVSELAKTTKTLTHTDAVIYYHKDGSKMNTDAVDEGLNDSSAETNLIFDLSGNLAGNYTEYEDEDGKGRLYYELTGYGDGVIGFHYESCKTIQGNFCDFVIDAENFGGTLVLDPSYFGWEYQTVGKEVMSYSAKDQQLRGADTAVVFGSIGVAYTGGINTLTGFSQFKGASIGYHKIPMWLALQSWMQTLTIKKLVSLVKVQVMTQLLTSQELSPPLKIMHTKEA